MNRWRGRLLVLVLVLIGAGTWWRLSDATSPLAAGSDEAQIGLTLYQGSAGIDLPEVQGRTIDG